MIILKSLISPKEAIFHREKCLWPTAFLADASMDVMWNSPCIQPGCQMSYLALPLD